MPMKRTSATASKLSEPEKPVETEEQGSDDEGPEVDPEEEDDEQKRRSELLALPSHGSEVYIGGITQDVSEGDVRQFCESIGKITELRMMKGKEANQNKGYAFVTFRTKELASTAIKELNNTELKGRKVKCSPAQAKHRLFIGNVPRNWGEEEMKKAVNKVGPGVIKIELLKDQQNSSRNRGFAFIEFYNNACAEYSRQKMSNPNFKLDDSSPTVSWADPRNADSSTSSQLPWEELPHCPLSFHADLSAYRILGSAERELFERHGKITKVVLPPAKPGQENSRYGFVHFAERSSAMKALKNTERYEIDGKVLDCSLAKPQADKKPSGGSNLQKGTTFPIYPPRLGYGMVGAPYSGVAAGIGHPLAYGRGATPAGMAMMPLLLPDGRIGYVLSNMTNLSHSLKSLRVLLFCSFFQSFKLDLEFSWVKER
nr:heterogeneous nuclear ribonucleoprotein R [Ipomoea batatas]